MKAKIIAALVAVAIVSPVTAKPAECTSMCHFFNAWAMTKLCPNLTFNKDGMDTDKDFGDLRILKRQSLKLDRHEPRGSLCHPSCMKASADDKEGTPCQYLKERAG